jgi:hypothetical protein
VVLAHLASAVSFEYFPVGIGRTHVLTLFGEEQLE